MAVGCPLLFYGYISKTVLSFPNPEDVWEWFCKPTESTNLTATCKEDDRDALKKAESVEVIQLTTQTVQVDIFENVMRLTLEFGKAS